MTLDVHLNECPSCRPTIVVLLGVGMPTKPDRARLPVRWAEPPRLPPRLPVGARVARRYRMVDGDDRYDLARYRHWHPDPRGGARTVA